MNHSNLTSPPPREDDSSYNEETYGNDGDELYGDPEKNELEEDEARDEIKELKKLSQRENNLVLTGKVMMVVGLLITVAAIWTSYALLVREQQESFEEAFGQFARSVRDAAVGQVEGIHLGLSTLAHSMTASAEVEAKLTNRSWPFFTLYDWASISRDVQIVSGMEVFSMFPLVEPNQQEEWIAYANSTYEGWIQDGHEMIYGSLDNLSPAGYKPFISQPSPDGFIPEEPDLDEYWPLWMYFPPPRSYGAVNWNFASVPDYENAIHAVIDLKVDTVVSQIRPLVTNLAFTKEQHDALHSELVDSESQYPHSFFFHPIHEILGDTDSKVVAVVATATGWDFSLRFLLPEGVSGILAVLENDCNQTHTYYLTGPDAIYIGEGDQHETKFDHLAQFVDLNIYENPEFTTTPGHCQYYMNVYPSTEFESYYKTQLPLIFAVVVTATFVVVMAIFLTYDTMVRERNKKLMKNAAVSNTLITSMFPGELRDKVWAKLSADKPSEKHRKKGRKQHNNQEMAAAPAVIKDEVLSEYYPATTILFADIAGFTAWSSVRQPTQVFELLGTIFHGFDEIAKKKGVFKIETVGDCYVAIVGVPKPVEEHAVVMASFAGEMRKCFDRIVRKLEVTLGPGTGDLAIRAGIHSGPAIGGVMPGHRARFQIFGDTMNTASRMESTGQPNCIQASKETAKLLMQAGKLGWLEKRQDVVFAKGKGDLQTYWVNPTRIRDGTEKTSDTDGDVTTRDYDDVDEMDFRMDQLVDYTVNALQELLKRIVAHDGVRDSFATLSEVFSPPKNSDLFLDEVKDVISLPKFDQNRSMQDPSTIELEPEVVAQLTDLVTRLRDLHNRDNHYNNFEHTGYAVMSVLKLLSNIAIPGSGASSHISLAEGSDEERLALLHPSTQFAILLSVMIKNVEHPGVPNPRVAIEKPDMAAHYMNRCINEQNSLATCWYLFMEPHYFKLRQLVCHSEEEERRFRQILVNNVVGTDITDPDFGKRNLQMLSAKKQEGHLSSNGGSAKATAVIEQLVLASEFAYTMQHPEIFRTWNKRRFFQSLKAYHAGRAGTNPAESWFQTQLDFFDSRMIPLAEKLKACGVFKECGDEYLNYARENRVYWQEMGEDIVKELVDEFAAEKHQLTSSNGN